VSPTGSVTTLMDLHHWRPSNTPRVSLPSLKLIAATKTRHVLQEAFVGRVMMVRLIRGPAQTRRGRVKTVFKGVLEALPASLS